MPVSQSSQSRAGLTGRIVLGRYRIVRPLARGGMGYVYLGRVEGAAGFAKPVVVKTILSSAGSAENERLFAREARIVSNLQHPGIVAVIDFGRVEDSCVMVLEYVHGYHLGQWFRYVHDTRGKMPLEFALYVVLQVLDALSFAHCITGPDGKALAIVHRDISPANVLIDAQGHVKLSDFGIARMADDEFKTQEGLFRGTLSFSAPEALSGSAPDPKLDQYGCAAVLYYLLAGKNPFRGVDTPQTMALVLSHTPPPLATLRDDVPPAVDAAIARALSKVPAERFESAAAFAQALRDGSEWSERAVAERFKSQIGQDFSGELLAERLEIESLAVRDASWRDAQGSGQSISLSSSPPSGGDARTQSSSSSSSSMPTVGLGPNALAPRPARIGIWIGLAALAAGAGSAAVLLFFTRTPPAPPPGVVVIEKQALDRGPASVEASDPQPANVPAAATASAITSAAAPAVVPPAASAPRAAKSAEDRGASLARSLQRQEARIQSCFQRHSQAEQETPRLSVRIQIDASGAVQNAQITPGSVAATALGQCILGVVKATQFGAQPEPVSFAIPIAARVVRP